MCILFVYVPNSEYWFMFVFFFFKQKTAYEMRISDWSSDVCSSDLIVDALDPLGKHPAAPRIKRCGFGMIARDDGARVARQFGGVRAREEIGRASCRERVCQYV